MTQAKPATPIRACIAMYQAFTRQPPNDEEKHNALMLAQEAIQDVAQEKLIVVAALKGG